MAKLSRIAGATPEQLTRTLDVDLWRRTAAGDERFDAGRFGELVTSLVDTGLDAAADTLAGLDPDLVTAGLRQHLRVYHLAAISPYVMLDGQPVAASRSMDDKISYEIGQYVVEATRTEAWEAIVELLRFLDAERPEQLHRVMNGCLRLSSDPPEQNGFHDLLEDADQHLFDLACAREARREAQGFVSPAQGRAFLLESRRIRIDGGRPARSAIAVAHFRAIGSPLARASERSPTHRAVPDPADAIAHARDSFVRAYAAAHARCEEEVGFLANTVAAGVSLLGRSLTPHEAAEAAISTSNLGLENWPLPWGEPDLITACQIGWNVLHREVCLSSATRLLEILLDIRCIDREIQLRLDGLRCELTKCLREGEPWRARDALDVVMMLDPPSWASLAALLDEHPVLHAAIGAAGEGRRSISATDFTFIAGNRDIELVRAFMAALPSALTG